MRMIIRILLCLLPCLTGARAQDLTRAELQRVQTLEPGFHLSGFRIIDTGRDARRRILLVGREGRVRLYEHLSPEGLLRDPPEGKLVLPDPEHALVSLADMRGRGGPPQLITASPKGLFAYALGPGGTFDPRPIPLTSGRRRSRGRFRLRTGRPMFSEMCRDVNDDGRPDVVLPVGEFCELWLNPKPEGQTTATEEWPRLKRTARLSVEVTRYLSYNGGRLSSVYESSFFIPNLRTRDVNGDGREDVVVSSYKRRAFHIQRPDGIIPPEPDIQLDLRIFRDTTPKGSIRPGRTLAGGDRQSMQSRDINGDGIPDYVIAHRRKVWVFHGTRQGPQFKHPAQILISSDDVTTLLLVNLDDDGHADLVVIKVLVPTVASLLLDALGGLEVDVVALGYAARTDGTFETTPRWRSEIVVKLPSLITILRDPDAILRRFEKVGRKFTGSEEGNLDGNSRPDIVKRETEPAELLVWRDAGPPSQGESDVLLRQVLFEDPDKSWDLERLLAWLQDVANAEIARRTGGRPPDVRYEMRPTDRFLLREFRLGDVDGDGRDEIVILYQPMDARASPILDIVELK